jgi:outer membrane lipoprotein-sorting protein
MVVRSRLRLCVVLCTLLPLAGCLSITRKTHGPRLSTAALKESTLEELVSRINTNASAMQSMNAKVDMDYTVGGRKKGHVTRYKEISGTILLRKPSALRIIGLVPVVHNRMFDMVSDGTSFQISIPGQNKYLVGTNRVNNPSENPLENLRPQFVFDALPLREIDAQNEIAVLEGGMELVKDAKTHQEAEQPDYEVIVLRKDNGVWYLSRKIIFSRVDLLPYHQLIYNRMGDVETDVRYDNYTTYGALLFPALIEIQRPIEEVGITLGVTKLLTNEPLRDDQFVLPQPQGVTVINLDEKRKNAAIEPGAEAKPKSVHEE